jgi:hypothetical protein
MRWSAASATVIRPCVTAATVADSGMSMPRAGDGGDGLGGGEALDGDAPGGRLPRAHGEARREVPRLGRGAGEEEVAKARQARERLGHRALGHGEARDLGEAARDDSRPRAFAQPRADGDARRQRDDVLERPAQFRPDDVVREVEPEPPVDSRS